MKRLLFSLILVVGLATTSFAQSNTEIAVVGYTPLTKDIIISINGKEYKKINVPKEQVKSHSDANAGLIEVSKLMNEGWELFNADTNLFEQNGALVYTFYLIRKNK